MPKDEKARFRRILNEYHENDHSLFSKTKTKRHLKERTKNYRMSMNQEALVHKEEIVLKCNDGIELAGQRWTTTKINNHNNKDNNNTIDVEASSSSAFATTTTRRKCLCLHGYLDNSSSFHILGPRIVSSSFLYSTGQQQESAGVVVEVVAIDFPGHGRSSHYSSDHVPMMVLSEFVFYVSEAVRLLHWQETPYVLIGHSMGSIVAIQYAATFSEQIETLVLLDGYGPEIEADRNNVSHRLRRHIERRYDTNHHPTIEKEGGGGSGGTFLTKKIYPTVDAATKTRLNTAKKCPGNQWLSEVAARELVQRALIPLLPQQQQHQQQHQHGGYYIFRHDPRLTVVGPILLHTFEQIDDYWNNLASKCRQIIWLRAEYGWPYDPMLIQRAENKLRLVNNNDNNNNNNPHQNNNTNNVVEILPGSHHFHADPETANLVVDTILKHLKMIPCTGGSSSNYTTPKILTGIQQSSVTESKARSHTVKVDRNCEEVVTPEEYR